MLLAIDIGNTNTVLGVYDGETKLTECKANVKTYWSGGDELMNLVRSGEVTASMAWDTGGWKLNEDNADITFVAPASGALGWIDTFVLPAKGQADDVAYEWINFVMQPEIVELMSASSGGTSARKGGRDLLPADKKAAVNAAFTDEDIANLQFFANIPPGVEDMEGKALEKIKAATGG